MHTRAHCSWPTSEAKQAAMALIGLFFQSQLTQHFILLNSKGPKALGVMTVHEVFPVPQQQAKHTHPWPDMNRKHMVASVSFQTGVPWTEKGVHTDRPYRGQRSHMTHGTVEAF